MPRVNQIRKRSTLPNRLDEHKQVFGSDCMEERLGNLGDSGLNCHRMSFQQTPML